MVGTIRSGLCTPQSETNSSLGISLSHSQRADCTEIGNVVFVEAGSIKCWSSRNSTMK